MAVTNYYDLVGHYGHNVEVAAYGKTDEEPANVAIECMTCATVLIDFDKETV